MGLSGAPKCTHISGQLWRPPLFFSHITAISATARGLANQTLPLQLAKPCKREIQGEAAQLSSKHPTSSTSCCRDRPTASRHISLLLAALPNLSCHLSSAPHIRTMRARLSRKWSGVGANDVSAPAIFELLWHNCMWFVRNFIVHTWIFSTFTPPAIPVRPQLRLITLHYAQFRALLTLTTAELHQRIVGAHDMLSTYRKMRWICSGTLYHPGKFGFKQR